MSVNTCAISGNLVADPVKRTTKSGAAVLNFTVAVGNRRRADAGVTEETPMYFDCVVFGERAKAVSGLLKKGVHVTVQGSLRQSSYQKGSSRVYKVEIAVVELDVAVRTAPQAPADEGGQKLASYAG